MFQLVTPELARRLLASGAVAARDVEAALYLSVVRGVSLPRALIDRGVLSERRLEEELLRRVGSALPTVSADPTLAAKVPAGMCRVLAAVPLWTEANGVVVVAAVDPGDNHIEVEFIFHLGQPVRVQRASMAAIEEAIRRLELDGGAPVRKRRRTPAFPHGAPDTVPPSPPPPPGTEDEPIPLVRKLAAPHLPNIPGYRSSTRALTPRSALGGAERLTADGQHDSPAAPRVSFPSAPPPPLAPDPDDFQLADVDPGMPASVRAGTAMALVASEPPRASLPPAGAPSRASSPPASAPSRASSPPASAPSRALDAGWSPTLPELLSLVRRAAHRDELVDLVMRGLTLIATRVAVFVAKKEGYQGFACNPAFGPEEALRQVLVKSDAPSIFATAAAAGYYLGPVPQTSGHLELLGIMREASTDVAVWVVAVRGKTAMMCVADELDDSLLGTRALSELCRAAADGLERLLAARAS